MKYEDHITPEMIRIIPPHPDLVIPPRWWMWLLPWKWPRCLRYRKRTLKANYTVDDPATFPDFDADACAREMENYDG